MERLTTRTDICCEPENDIVYYNPKDPDGLYNIIDLAKCVHEVDGEEANILLEISNRLAAYEDIEKSPEEINSSLEDYKDVSQQYSNFVHEMQPLKEAKADGRLVVLPCKVGDTVYRLNGIYSWDIEHIEIYGDEIIFVDDSDNIFRLDDIGKTVFLTREAAENALGGAEG